MIDSTAKFSNFFDQTAAEKTMFIRGCQKDSFNFLRQRFVGMRHLQLHLKIR